MIAPLADYTPSDFYSMILDAVRTAEKDGGGARDSSERLGKIENALCQLVGRFKSLETQLGELRGAVTAGITVRVFASAPTAPKVELAPHVTRHWPELPVRAANALLGDNIVDLETLTTRTEVDLMRMPNFGRRSLHDVKNFLAARGRQLRSVNGAGA